MTMRTIRLPSALKHAAFSETDVLPGEDPTAFKKLRQDLFAEFSPAGILEEEIVANIARLLWRKRNLVTYWLAIAARNRYQEILGSALSTVPPPPGDLSSLNLPAVLDKDKYEAH